MPTCQLPCFLLPPSTLQELEERGGEKDDERGEKERLRKRGGEKDDERGEKERLRKRGREGSTRSDDVWLVLSPRYSGVLLHISAVSCLPRKHPNPPPESLTCLPSVASSRFSVYGGGDTTD